MAFERDSYWHEVFIDAIPRLGKVHFDMGRLAAWLRNSAVSIWTRPATPQELQEAPSLPPANTMFVFGWWEIYDSEATRLNLIRTRAGVRIADRMPHIGTQLDKYLDAMPRVLQALTACLNQYRNGGGALRLEAVLMAHRNQLATAIEAELEP